ncbi:tetratricopeptide repeat protein [Rugosimonospora africana]|uniref:Tetratricopeptide repeat-containing protein n=1 Tax=Rugosimonospora africana TaxID=556532 RepID=A0A8J3R0F9_9ACTN|nr:tetratricopeptide repeat protein [Rugosimonospora africana]GIH20719.1 hypothetical protein Raf01_88910 [Rugosimonospora africana]
MDDELWQRVSDLCRERDYRAALTAVDVATVDSQAVDSPTATVLRAWVRAEQGERREARLAVERLLATRGTPETGDPGTGDPATRDGPGTRDDLETHLLAVRFFHRLGDHGASILYARRATRIAPDSAEAWRLLARAYRERRRQGRALVAARRSVALAPDSLDSRLMLASVLSRFGPLHDAREANEQLAEAALLAPDSPKPQEVAAAERRVTRSFWVMLLVCAGANGLRQMLFSSLGHRLAMVAGGIFVTLLLALRIGMWLSDTRSYGQTILGRISTRRARGREDTAAVDGVLGWTASNDRALLPLVPALALGPHTVAAALGSPFPRWTLVFPLAGTALLAAAAWYGVDSWLGAGVFRRAVRLSAPLRRQLGLTAALIGAGVALLAADQFTPGPMLTTRLWIVAAVSLVAWAFVGPLAVGWLSRHTLPEE